MVLSAKSKLNRMDILIPTVLIDSELLVKMNLF